MHPDPLELRKRIGKLRESLTLAECETLTRRITENTVAFFRGRWPPETWKDQTVASYRVAEGNVIREVDPIHLANDPYFAHTTFAYPQILSRADGTMRMAVTLQESDWRKGAYGLHEPRPELPAVAPKELSVIFCPGVVFDELGSRVGRGGGFYDRYLFHAPGALRVGLAYDFQVLRDAIPQEMHDQRMDVIITETRVLTFGDRSPIPNGS